jgi:hypothetical protein
MRSLIEQLGIARRAVIVAKHLFFVLRLYRYFDRIALRIELGIPEQPHGEHIHAINNLLMSDGIEVRAVLHKQPLLDFKAKLHETIDFDPATQAAEAKILQEKRLVDEPVAVLTNSGDFEHNQINLIVLDRYTKAKSALPLSLRESMRILGANTLLIDRDDLKLVLHKRSALNDDRTSFLHGSGGNYLPYVPPAPNVRVDDRSRLQVNASRELLQELNVVAHRFVPNYIVVIEQKNLVKDHTSGLGSKGHLTFFYVGVLTRESKELDNLTPLQAGAEGQIVEIDINTPNIRTLALCDSIEVNGSKYPVHPQLRAMIMVWVCSGCPGIPFKTRYDLSKARLKENLIADLTVEGTTST